MIQIIALLYAGEHGIEGLRAFESKAIPILRAHKGVLISATYNHNKSAAEADEIHVIQFPNIEAFDAYKTDARMLDLAALKHTMIAKTEMFVTHEFHQY